MAIALQLGCRSPPGDQMPGHQQFHRSHQLHHHHGYQLKMSRSLQNLAKFLVQYASQVTLVSLSTKQLKMIRYYTVYSKDEGDDGGDDVDYNKTDFGGFESNHIVDNQHRNLQKFSLAPVLHPLDEDKTYYPANKRHFIAEQHELIRQTFKTSSIQPQHTTDRNGVDQSDDHQIVRSLEIRPFKGKQAILWQETRVPPLTISFRIYMAVSSLACIIAAIKYSILCLLDIKLLRDYRWLDCYLMGRFSYTARTTDAAKYVALMLSSFHMILRFVLLIRKPRLELEQLEFLMFDLDEVEAEELRAEQRLSMFWVKRNRGRANIRHLYDTMNAATRQSKRCSISNNIESSQNEHDNKQGQPVKLKGINSLFYIDNSLCSVDSPSAYVSPAEDDDDFKFIFKPNRTAWSWRALAWTAIGVLVLGIFFNSSLAFFIIHASSPLLQTEKGFEYNYFNCLDWLQRQSKEVWPNYKHIYEMRENFTHDRHADVSVLPYEKILPYNGYHLTRMTIDIIDNIFTWFDLLIVILSCSVVITLEVADLFNYSLAIKSNLEKLIEALGRPRLFSLKKSSTSLDTKEKWIQNRSYKEHSDWNHSEIVATQRIVVDYFKLIGKYNNHARIVTLFFVFTWITYSFLVCGYTFGATNLNGMADYYYVQCVVTSMVVVTLGSFGLIKTMSYRLYPLLATAMALDSSTNKTKSRWITILDYYWPKPQSCFRIMEKTEISWLFCLKLLFWMLSASIVIAGLYAQHEGLTSSRIAF